MKQLVLTPLAGPVTASVDIPGSKSYTNRALLLAALTAGPVSLINPLVSDDTRAMIGCLESLGIKVSQRADAFEVVNDISAVHDRDYELNADLSGTTIRFMLALACVIPGRQTLHGQAGLQKRPIGHLVDALRQLGAEIEYLEVEGFPPLRVNSSLLSGSRVTIDGRESSQYLSALLMIAPLVGELTIEIQGELSSRPFVTMTADVMAKFGVQVVERGSNYHIAGQQSYKTAEYVVEGDVSSGSYFAAIAALTGSTLTLNNLSSDSQQADMGFLKILEDMGNVVTPGSNQITVAGHGVQPVTVNMQHCPDQAQTLAVLAAFTDGMTTIKGIQSLRIKETERIKALQQELSTMGIKTSSTKGSLTIHGGQPQPATIATYGDHRMAMAFAVAGARLNGLTIEDPDVVSKTFPTFWQQLAAVGVRSRTIKPNIVLIGMRGSGKTTIAAELARKLGCEQLDIDARVVEVVGLSEPQIVERYGWDYFRDQESAIAQEVSEFDNKVISTGGGIILRPKNITALRRHGLVIFLQASADVLIQRLGDSYDRPPLTHAKTLSAEIRQVLKQRRTLYEAAADIIINVDAAAPADIADQIIARLGKENL